MEKKGSIKDLVIQVLTNGSEIKSKAESGDALSCFQMGMIHLLGINTPIDFKKAENFFGNQLLVDNFDANRLLGFIAECEGNYSQAFQYYAKNVNSEKDSYLDKVIKGRNHLQDYLKKLDLSIILNKEISSILNDYADKNLKTGASIKLAAICSDELSCLEAAKNLYESKDYISAIQWLKEGNVDADNPIYIEISEKYENSKKDLLNSKVPQVVDLNSYSLLTKEGPALFLNNVKNACNTASLNCLKEWKTKCNSYVDAVVKEKKEQDHRVYLKALAEEEERNKRRKKIIKYSAIAAVVLLLCIIGAFSEGSEKSNDKIAAEDTLLVNSEIENQTNDGGYISILSEKKLSDSDLKGKSNKELEIMRNSIYARHGYRFKRDDLSAYFSQFSWYTPKTNDMTSVYSEMSEIEKYNVDFIKKHE